MNPQSELVENVVQRVGVWKRPREGVAVLHIGSAPPWFIELKQGQAPAVTREERPAQCVLRLSDEGFHALVSGALSPQVALAQHALELEGDVALAQSFARAALR